MPIVPNNTNFHHLQLDGRSGTNPLAREQRDLAATILHSQLCHSGVTLEQYEELLAFAQHDHGNCTRALTLAIVQALAAMDTTTASAVLRQHAPAALKFQRSPADFIVLESHGKQLFATLNHDLYLEIKSCQFLARYFWVPSRKRNEQILRFAELWKVLRWLRQTATRHEAVQLFRQLFPLDWVPDSRGRIRIPNLCGFQRQEYLNAELGYPTGSVDPDLHLYPAVLQARADAALAAEAKFRAKQARQAKKLAKLAESDVDSLLGDNSK